MILNRLGRALALGVVLILAGCPSAATRVRPPAIPQSDTTLGPNDEFAVAVFGETELSQTYRVQSDGSIFFPYLERVAVGGLAPSQVEDLLRTQLRERGILQQPHVTVRVTAVNSRSISVLGQVQRPGTFPWSQSMSIVQALTLAGGFTATADQGGVRLTRRERNGAPHTYQIAVDAITQGREPSVDVGPGDVIFVPERVF